MRSIIGSKYFIQNKRLSLKGNFKKMINNCQALPLWAKSIHTENRRRKLIKHAVRNARKKDKDFANCIVGRNNTQLQLTIFPLGHNWISVNKWSLDLKGSLFISSCTSQIIIEDRGSDQIWPIRRQNSILQPIISPWKPTRVDPSALTLQPH